MPKAKKDSATSVAKVKKVKAAKTVEETTSVSETVPETSSQKDVKVSQETSSKSSKKPSSMEELLASARDELKIPKHGDVVEGVVTDISKKAVFVDIAGKTEGMIIDKEFEIARDFIDKLHVGDKVSVYIVSAENDRGQILLSFKRAVMNQRWDQFEEAMKTEEVVTVRGVELNKGGMIVTLDGVRGFIPTSQFGKQYIGKLESMLDQPLKVRVIEVDKEKNRLIFSERHISEAQSIAQKTAVMDTVKEHEIYEGIISGVLPFGVFVTVEVPLEGKETGKIEGLVHISEISWEKIENPGQHYKVGDKVKVKVLSVDKETGKLNLSIKRLSDDPWSVVVQKYPEGAMVSGTVSRIAPFGVFVNLEPGVDGLIHISKLPTGKEPKVGEKIEVSVEKVEPETRRMRLSVLLTEVPVDYR